MHNNSLYIVMPAYNEESNIEEVVRQWYPIVDKLDDKSRVVIADSGSTDTTHDILVKLQEELPKLEVLANTEKQHGPKLIALYKYAIQNGIDYIFQTDSDGQTNPEEFMAFWEAREEYDLVIGNRTKRGDGKDRAFVEKVVCILLKLYFGVSIPDANAPFRLMKSNIVGKYVYYLADNYSLPNIILTMYYARYKEKVLFKEISFKPRVRGKNSINIGKIIKIGWKSLFEFHQIKKDIIKRDNENK